MKKLGLLLLVLALGQAGPGAAFAAMGGSTEGHKTEMGLDVEMPYVFEAGGASVDDRGDTLVGVHGNYFLQPEWSVGLQLDFAVETQTAGADNAFLVSPGTAWYFNPANTWNPYVRFDIPMALTGGGATGDGFDFGVSGGVGLQWNLNELTGAEGWALKYDTAFNYFFDAELSSINIFRLAVAYCW